MSHLQGQVGEVRMRLEIKRAATGKTEIVDVVGKIDTQEQLDALRREYPNLEVKLYADQHQRNS